jgi:hypothetical protein
MVVDFFIRVFFLTRNYMKDRSYTEYQGGLLRLIKKGAIETISIAPFKIFAGMVMRFASQKRILRWNL